MNSFESRFHRELGAKLDEALAAEIEHVAAGKARDWPDYQMRVGKIRALKQAKDLAEDARRALSGDDDQGED